MDPDTLIESKQEDTLVFSARDVLALRWKTGKSPNGPPPDLVILCYQPRLLDFTRKTFRTQKVEGFFGELYRIKAADGRVAVAGNFGIGAPAAVIMLEELAAYGVRRIVSIGLAGTLQPDLLPGAVVVCHAALRDEGTSRHYLPDAVMVTAHPDLTRELEQSLSKRKIAFRAGSVWTTDAPYRETREKVESLQKDGFLAVEMEASAVLAAGQALGIPAGAAFVVSDSLAGGRWEPDADPKRVMRALQDLSNAVLGIA